MSASIYPTGTTIYNPEKCWNGFTLFQTGMNAGSKAAAVLIDMNGNTVNMWKGMDGFPNKLLPGGYIMGSTGARDARYGHQDMLDVVQADWNGNIVWKFNEYELIKDPGHKSGWMARQHHDYQREGNPVGYYVPDMEPLVDRGNTLVLCHKNVNNPDISDKTLLDDAIIEVNWKGELIWEWVCSEHFNEMGFTEVAKNTLYRLPHPMKNQSGEVGDWMHMNSMSFVGPNKWYDSGDERFNPSNIIWDGRSTNIIGIISKKTGKIVWQTGPDYNSSALKNIGQIIGQHHAHIIPRGLPGEGNLLVFDNGGWAGYGAPNPGSASGLDNALRDYSRIIEFNPVSLQVVWQYPPPAAGPMMPMSIFNFYSSLISSAQRLPNGNTLITEGICGRIFELTTGYEIVWEYINPFKPEISISGPGPLIMKKGFQPSLIYRAYRAPYGWIPQAERPNEIALKPIDNSKFRIPHSPKITKGKITHIKTNVKATQAQYCAIPNRVKGN